MVKQKINLKVKSGWIKIAEALISILIISIILLVVVQKELLKKQDFSEEIYASEEAILNEIRINQSLREEIVNVIPPKTIGEAGFPIGLREVLKQKFPISLTCLAKVCHPDDACLLLEDEATNIYSRFAFISTDGQIYSPKKLKISCKFIE